MRSALIIISLAALTACGPTPVAAPDAAADLAAKMKASAEQAGASLDMTAPTVGAHVITEAEYAQVQTGMTVDQAMAIVGPGCSEVTSVESPEIRFQAFACVNANGTSANLSFQNGALVQKAKSGDLG